MAIISIIGAGLYAHYRFVGGAYLTFRRKRHEPAANAIAQKLIQLKIEHSDADSEQRYRLLRQAMVDGLNNWGVKRRLVQSFKLSLRKAIEEQEQSSGTQSLFTWEVDKAIDNIVLCFDKDPTWR